MILVNSTNFYAILKAACLRAMVPEGKLLLVEVMIPPSNIPHPGQLLDIVMWVGNVGGRERTEAVFRALLAAAGLTLFQVYPTPGNLSLVEGTRV